MSPNSKQGRTWSQTRQRYERRSRHEVFVERRRDDLIDQIDLCSSSDDDDEYEEEYKYRYTYTRVEESPRRKDKKEACRGLRDVVPAVRDRRMNEFSGGDLLPRRQRGNLLGEAVSVNILPCCHGNNRPDIITISPCNLGTLNERNGCLRSGRHAQNPRRSSWHAEYVSDPCSDARAIYREDDLLGGDRVMPRTTIRERDTYYHSYDRSNAWYG